MLLYSMLCLAAPALDASATPSDVDFALDWSWRVSGHQISDMDVDRDDKRYGQNGLSSHRLRLEPVLSLGKAATVTGDVQLATGHLGWDTVNPRYGSWGPPRADDGKASGAWADQLKVRKLYLTWTTALGQLRLGRMTSH